MIDQTSQFFAILTNVGAAKQANADALGTAWKITQMGVGDANGTDPVPNASQKSLISEWRRAPLNQLKVDPNNASIIIAEQVIPADVGGKWIREIGLYDDAGDLVAVANCAPSFKPLLTQGSGKTQVVRMNLIVSNTAMVELKIDPSVVLATKEFVLEELAKQDFKHSVLVATTANITLSGLQSSDGVAIPSGKRVLVRAQNVVSQNGIYSASSGAWIRSTDANNNDKVTPGMLVHVEQGTLYGDSAWQLVTDGPVALGVTSLTFEMAFGRTGVAAGSYRTVTVDKYGRVVSGTNPTTASGYGITDVYTKSEVFTKTETSKAVSDAIAVLVGAAPGYLDQINELAAAINNDPNFASTMIAELAKKAPLVSPDLTGIPKAPTAAVGTDSTQIATMAAIKQALAWWGIGTSSARQVTDLNSVTEGGDYFAMSTAANMPAAVNSNITHTAFNGISAAMQTVTALSSPVRQFFRTKSNGTWLGWQEFATLAGPSFTGDVSMPTRPTDDRSANGATTQFVANLLASLGLGTQDLADMPTGVDCDTLIKGGSYQVNGAVNSPTYKKAIYSSGVVWVMGSNASSYTHQFFGPQGLNRLFHRCSNGAANGFGEWELITTEKDVKGLIAGDRRYYPGSVVGGGSGDLTITADQAGYAFNITTANTVVTLPPAADVGVGASCVIRNVSGGNVTVKVLSGIIHDKTNTAATFTLSANEWIEVQVTSVNYLITKRGLLDKSAPVKSPVFDGEVVSVFANAWRMRNDKYSSFWRNDGNTLYLMLTNLNDPDGAWNALRPFSVDLATGIVTCQTGFRTVTPAASDNSNAAANTAWFQRELANYDGRDAGQVGYFAMATPPSGWLKRNGAAVSRTTYARLFAVIGTTFGAGDGSTTFNLPDGRATFDRGLDEGRNLDKGRVLGSFQGTQNANHTHGATTAVDGAHTHTMSFKLDRSPGDAGNAVFGDEDYYGTYTGSTSSAGAHNHAVTIGSSGGDESRPYNVAYLPCIRY